MTSLVIPINTSQEIKIDRDFVRDNGEAYMKEFKWLTA
jgi:hypothetical protein